ASLGLRVAVGPFLAGKTPYAISFIGVMFTARYFGLGPSMFSAITGGIASTWLFVGADLTRSTAGVPLISYVVLCAVMIWLMEQQRREHIEARENARLASERLKELQRETAERERQQGVSAKLQAIVESSEDSIVSKNLDGVIQSWNKSAELIYGYSSEEMLGKTMAPLLPPDRVQEEADILER